MIGKRWLAAVVCGALLGGLGGSPIASADALDRLKIPNLQATRAAIEALATERQPVSRPTGFDDVRAALHVHSLLSHDSRSTLEEVLEGARAAGVRVVMFNEHPADHYDYVSDGHRGLYDGILVLPGAETEGYLAYPRSSLKGAKSDSPQAFADLVLGTGGMIFLCHLEERMDWDIHGITGNEIYNTHADLKNDAGLLASFGQPLKLLGLVGAIDKYPQESFGALLDYPADYLARWDQLCQTARHTGVAGNDSHHNTGLIAQVGDDGKLHILDRIKQPLTVIDPEKVPLVKGLVQGKKPGDVVVSLDLDPYERSLRHVSTHLLLSELTPEQVDEALRQSRAYVSFDWLADPSGFRYELVKDNQRWPVGSEVKWSPGMSLEVEATLPGFIRLLKSGQELATGLGRQLSQAIDAPGIYRAEVWLNVAGERRPWILSNPIYVRE